MTNAYDRVTQLETITQQKDVTDIGILSLTPSNCRQHQVINIHVPPTSMLPEKFKVERKFQSLILREFDINNVQMIIT